jgi:hypothetical protein
VTRRQAGGWCSGLPGQGFPVHIRKAALTSRSLRGATNASVTRRSSVLRTANHRYRGVDGLCSCQAALRTISCRTDSKGANFFLALNTLH